MLSVHECVYNRGSPYYYYADYDSEEEEGAVGWVRCQRMIFGVGRKIVFVLYLPIFCI